MRNIEEIKADINLCTGCMTNRHDCDENCNDCLYINYDKNYYRLRQENYNWYKDRDSRAKAISGIKTSRLEEICNAERDGRCVVLPCKVGDVLYVLTSDSLTGIEETKCKRITIKTLQDGSVAKIIAPCVLDDWGGAFRELYLQDFGKTVFLTRAEAEAALKRRNA